MSEKERLNTELLDEDDDEGEDTQEDKFLTFIIGKEDYGIEIRYVTEIIGIQGITGVPDMPSHVKGVINLRGKVIPVMDVRRRFGLAETTYTERTVIIVLDINNAPIGLVVDAVSEVLEIPEAQIDEPPKFGANRDGTGVIKGLGKQGDRVAILLDVERLVSEQVVDRRNDPTALKGAA